MRPTMNAILALAALFAPLALAAPPVGSVSSCSTGTVTCCDSLQDSSSLSRSDIFSIMSELQISAVVGQVGMACSSPLSGEALGGSVSCRQQTACCDNVSANGLVAAGCMPMTLPAA
ncbi:hypothetical protein HGRIS_005018 [Hohenbuehelia grisea]|uniref:Hydrophobin n=1 Tax=Hohenbuehelia grisea TaxID=104357 RepID=A0ABR3JE61_9AGAR